MTTYIKNGTVISATGATKLDVLIDGEIVAAVYHPGSTLATTAEESASSVIDAAGKYVIPGGVDVHTHMELPFGGTYASDTFESGTRAAAWGGTTTIVDFAVQSHGRQVRECLDEWHAKAEGNCAIDYGFHMIIGEVNEASLKEMTILVDEGLSSFKLFMAYPGVFYSDDGQILRAMQNAAETGGMIMMHAENGIAIDVLAEQAVSRGETDPIYHGMVRRAELESEATHRAIQLAKVGAAPLYIVHLSASGALEEVTRARNNGANVFAETCPQYLYLNLEDHLGAPGFQGAGYVCSTPLRTKHEHHHADLWKGLRTDDLSVVSTDHCPFCMKDQKSWDETTSGPSPTESVGSSTGWTSSTRGWSTARSAWPAGLSCARPPRPGCSGSTPERGHPTGLGRRHRDLRPQRQLVDQRRQPSHEHGLLGLRGHRGRRQGPDRAVEGPGHRRQRPVPGLEG